MLPQFAFVAAFELDPAVGIVTEPFAQLRAWRDVLHPVVDGGFLLGQAPRPKAVDQHAHAVAGRGRLVDALQPKAFCGCWLLHL